MKGVSDYVLVYDITSDRERRKVDKVLRSYGFRVQKSVFECRMTKRSKDELLEKLRKLDVKSGFIKVYRLEFSLNPPAIGEVKKGSLDDEGPAFVL